MSGLKRYFQPLTYQRYLPALFGVWLIAFAVGIWFGKDLGRLALPAFTIGLIIHGTSMHEAHKQSHVS